MNTNDDDSDREAPAYIQRLCHHMAILVAHEDTSMVLDPDRVMLALVFMKAHCRMVLEEMGPVAARAHEKK